MPTPNVEIVRSLYEVGDGAPLTATSDQIDRAFRDHVDQRFELRMPPDYPEGEPVFRGREGLAQVLAMLADTWSEFRFQPERFLDAGDRVVVFARIRAQGGASGVPIELETTHVWTLRKGRVRSMHAFRDRSQALEAAGLEE